jgi:hypothetical protein
MSRIDLQKSSYVLIGILILGGAALFFTSINNNLIIDGDIQSYASNDTRLIGNMSISLELSNGTTLDVAKEKQIFSTECGPGSVWEALGLC